MTTPTLRGQHPSIVTGSTFGSGTPEVVAPPVQPGELVAGKYRVDRVLGVGGMGVVVAATHEQLDQQVALKFLLAEAASHPDVVERFLREARAAVKIRSEHVARVLDVGTLPPTSAGAPGGPYMVMELLEGEDLEQALARRGALTDQEAVGHVLEALEAIAEAHSIGIVHRDLKPANLFLAASPSGRATVKVLDFGISKVPLTEKQRALTQDAALMGTPAYMSPEQMKASRAVDARSDIWSIGVVLHELVSGNLPFAGDTMAVLVASILFEKQLPAGGAAPSALQPIIDRCLAKDPDDRFADVADLARALGPFGPLRSAHSVERIEAVLRGGSGARGAPDAGKPLAPTSLASATSSRTLSPMATPQPAGRAMRRLVAWVAPLAAVALALALVAAFVVSRPRTERGKGSAVALSAEGSGGPEPAPAVAPHGAERSGERAGRERERER